ncbi:MAG: pyridoxal-phosphate dependent enzyme, partial [Chloroflexi bacterium]|nr:pyridoxal-phosphate dependent enzyme [Chloroflexota bacterium]
MRGGSDEAPSCREGVFLCLQRPRGRDERNVPARERPGPGSGDERGRQGLHARPAPPPHRKGSARPLGKAQRATRPSEEEAARGGPGVSFATALRCRECARQYPVQPSHVCEFCFGPLEVTYDYEAIAKVISRERIAQGPLGMWRYRDLLPVSSEAVVDIHTGFTPLVRADRLARELGLRQLYLKNDCVNPTYSFKDRVVSVAATKAREFGFQVLACASTGNLAGSVAAHAARAGMEAFIFIPADLEQGKIVGAGIYAPTLV